MAIITKIVLLVCTVAVANAAYASSFASSRAGGQDQGQNQGFLGIGLFPGLPSLPGFGAFHIISPDEIANAEPDPNSNYHMMAVKSKSEMARDKDGNLVRTGGTTAVVNDNGEKHEFKVGDAPPAFVSSKPTTEQNFNVPDVPDVSNSQEVPDSDNLHEESEESNSEEFDFLHHTFEHILKPFKPHNPLKFEPISFKPFKFEPITFKPFTFKPIVFKPIVPLDTEKMANYQPGENEQYVAHSSSSFSQSSDINGVKESSGGATKMVNLNGDVEKSVAAYNQADKPKKHDDAEVEDEE